MPSFNQVNLIGNLTRDPMMRYTGNQTAITEFGLAMNRKFKVGEDQREEVCFVDCTAFGKAAEILNQYVKKGAAIFVSGRLKYDTWDDKNGGGKRSKLFVVIEQFQFLGGREQQEKPSPAEAAQSRARTVTAPPMDEQIFKEDDIPFAGATA